MLAMSSISYDGIVEKKDNQSIIIIMTAKTAKRKSAGRRKPGRPTFLTPTIRDRIIEKIREGNYISVAFQSVGISPYQYDEWIEKGERGIKPFVEFARLVKIAYAEAETYMIEKLKRAGDAEQYVVERRTHTRKDGTTEETIRYATPQWQSTAWILERTRNDRYGERSNLTLQFSKGIDFVKRIQKAREAKAIDGEYRELPPTTPQLSPASPQQATAPQETASPATIMETTDKPSILALIGKVRGKTDRNTSSILDSTQDSTAQGKTAQHEPKPKPNRSQKPGGGS